jgi:hypothetical protein
MYLRSLATGSLLLLAGLPAVDRALAQQFVGFDSNATPGATSRGGILAAGAALARIDAADYAGWATSPMFPGARVITGIDCIVQDQDAVMTPDTFGVAIYPESPVMPGFPALGAGVLAAAVLPGPPPPAAGLASAMYSSVAFGAPVLMPVGGDVFIGLLFPPAPAWPADGISFQVVMGYAAGPGFATFDLPGPTLQPLGPPNGPANSYGAYTDFGPVLAYAARRQIWADIDSPAPGGVVTAITAQASFPISGAPPGTASFMSALHPDAVAPPFNPGRADNVGYIFSDSVLGAGAPVFFLANLGGFGPEMPLAFLAPGSIGVMCLGPASLSTGLGFTDPTGTASLVIPIPAAVRPVLAGLPLLQQAISIDVVTGALHAAPCGSQKL